MSAKKILGLTLMLISLGAHAIPPAPPASIIKKIKTKSATKCVTANNISVSDLNETEKVKFDLQLNSSESAGVLTLIEDNLATESFEVSCN